MGKLFFLLCISIVVSNNSNAQLKATATASTSAIIITPVGTQQFAEMEFGKFKATAEKSTINLSCDGILVTKGKVNMIDQNGCAAAFFNIGAENSSYTISLNYDNELINSTNDNEKMKIDLYSINMPSLVNKKMKVTETIAVGATLEIGSEQQHGNYRAANPYYLTVNFN